MTSRPDIIVLVLDTQRADRLSCYGCPVETSPHLDTLATDATLFRHAASAAQWTVPSHTSMFTGLYPSEHGTLHASSVVPTSLPLLAERLRDSGYFTAAFCNNPLVGVVNNGLRRGFLDFFNYSGLLTSRPNQAGTHAGGIDRARQNFKRALAAGVTAMQDIFARSDTLLSFSFSPLMVPLWQTALSFKGNTARSLRDAARLHLERKGVEQGQPIFSFINLMGTHMPYHPPQRFVERFAPHVLTDKAEQRYLRRFNGDVFGWLAPLEKIMDDEHKRTLDGMYNAEVAYQDELLGDFFQKLRSSGKLDQTLLIITADHGEHLGEKRLIGHSMSAYHELVSVPLLIRDPQSSFPRTTTIDTPVSTRRIFFTALEAAQIASAEEEELTLAHTGFDDPDKGMVFSEAIPPLNMVNLMRRHAPQLLRERDFDLTRRAIRYGPYKLIHTEGRAAELYNILADPLEAQDLHESEAGQAAFLQAHLQTFSEHRPFTLETTEEAPTMDNVEDPEVLRRLRDLGYVE